MYLRAVPKPLFPITPLRRGFTPPEKRKMIVPLGSPRLSSPFYFLRLFICVFFFRFFLSFPVVSLAPPFPFSGDGCVCFRFRHRKLTIFPMPLSRSSPTKKRKLHFGTIKNEGKGISVARERKRNEWVLFHQVIWCNSKEENRSLNPISDRQKLAFPKKRFSVKKMSWNLNDCINDNIWTSSKAYLGYKYSCWTAGGVAYSRHWRLTGF